MKNFVDYLKHVFNNLQNEIKRFFVVPRRLSYSYFFFFRPLLIFFITHVAFERILFAITFFPFFFFSLFSLAIWALAMYVFLQFFSPSADGFRLLHSESSQRCFLLLTQLSICLFKRHIVLQIYRKGS
jgi:hypothetical protein